MGSGKSSGFFICFWDFWFLASTYLHISGFFCRTASSKKILGFCFLVSLACWWLYLATVPARRLMMIFLPQDPLASSFLSLCL